MVLEESSPTPWTGRRTNKWALGQIKPETSLEAKMTRTKLTYFQHIVRRQGSLEKDNCAVKIESSRKRGRPNMRWIGSTEAIGTNGMFVCVVRVVCVCAYVMCMRYVQLICLHVSVWHVCLHGWYGLCGMYMCLAQHIEAHATHKENHKGTPPEEPTLAEGRTGAPRYPQIVGTSKLLTGLKPQGSCSLKFRLGEMHTWEEGWVLQMESWWGSLGVTQGP